MTKSLIYVIVKNFTFLSMLSPKLRRYSTQSTSSIHVIVDSMLVNPERPKIAYLHGNFLKLEETNPLHDRSDECHGGSNAPDGQEGGDGLSHRQGSHQHAEEDGHHLARFERPVDDQPGPVPKGQSVPQELNHEHKAQKAPSQH